MKNRQSRETCNIDEEKQTKTQCNMCWTQLCASKNHDTWLTATEYLCYTSPRICPVLLSSSGEEADYRSRTPYLIQVSSCNGITAVDLYIIYETKRSI
jgi:hypothetical protein